MIRAILIDAMNTIFTLKEINKYEMLKCLITEYLGKNVEIDRVKKEYDAKRAEFEPLLKSRSLLVKWKVINKEIILALFPEIPESQAEETGALITIRVASDPSLYRVEKGVRDFLKEARQRGIKIIIASNQDSDCLRKLILSFGLEKLLDAVYDSDRLKAEKPDPLFFQKILEEDGLEPETCLMVGNDPIDDVRGPQQVGIRGVLLDREDEYPETAGQRIRSLKELWTLDVFKKG